MMNVVSVAGWKENINPGTKFICEVWYAESKVKVKLFLSMPRRHIGGVEV